MLLAANLLVLIVAMLHFYFLVLEMVMWTRPLGKKIFRLSDEKAEMTKSLAMNQGLYNGFLAAGLVWSLFAVSAEMAMALKVFFLSCVGIAGIVGALTVSRRIFFIQALPALMALVLVFLSPST